MSRYNLTVKNIYLTFIIVNQNHIVKEALHKYSILINTFNQHKLHPHLFDAKKLGINDTLI